MAAGSSARYLAPVALIAVGIALIVVVGGSGGEGSSQPADGSAPPAQTATRPTARRVPRTYVIKSGDLLSSIAEHTGVTVERLTELNPGLDPTTLVPGQRIKLVP